MVKTKKPAKKRAPGKSPALKLFEMLHGDSKTKSWRTLNEVLSTTMRLAIDAGLRFGPKDFAKIYEDYGGSYWLGEGEYYYQKAIEIRNTSACQAFEAWKDRPAFIFNGKRMHLGSSFPWDGRTVKVTSFGSDHRGHFLGCCSYRKEKVEGSEYKRDVVDKRYKVSLAELKSKEPAKQLPKVEPLMRKFLAISHYCERGKTFLHKHLTAKSAWEACGKGEEAHGSFDEMRRLVRDVKFPVLLTDYEALQNCDQIRALVGDFDVNFKPLLEKYVDGRVKEERDRRRARNENKGT